MPRAFDRMRRCRSTGCSAWAATSAPSTSTRKQRNADAAQKAGSELNEVDLAAMFDDRDRALPRFGLNGHEQIVGARTRMRRTV